MAHVIGFVVTSYQQVVALSVNFGKTNKLFRMIVLCSGILHTKQNVSQQFKLKQQIKSKTLIGDIA